MNKNYMTNKELTEVMTTVFGAITERDQMAMIKNIADDDRLDLNAKMKKIGVIMKAMRMAVNPPMGAADITEEEVEPVKRHTRIPFEKKKQMIDYYYEHEGVTQREVAEIFNVPLPTLRSILKRHRASIKEKEQDK